MEKKATWADGSIILAQPGGVLRTVHLFMALTGGATWTGALVRCSVGRSPPPRGCGESTNNLGPLVSISRRSSSPRGILHLAQQKCHEFHGRR
jgi:hypothetical protein